MPEQKINYVWKLNESAILSGVKIKQAMLKYFIDNSVVFLAKQEYFKVYKGVTTNI